MTQSAFPLLHQNEFAYILDRLIEAQSVSLVGVSNVGKSTLLRRLCQRACRQAVRPDLADALDFLYVDCNHMVDQSEQAFYELVIRVLMAALEQDSPEIAASLGQNYKTLLHPPTEFHIPLSFNLALINWIERNERRSVLIFDEFDAAYATLDSRVFLNLRAFKDRYGDILTFITATDRRLAHIRVGEEVDEFREVFGSYVLYVQPLNEADTRVLIHEHAARLSVHFDERDVSFLLEQAGGHPVLTRIACRVLAQELARGERSPNATQSLYRRVREALQTDLGVATECDRIWRDLTDREQGALLSLVGGGEQRDANAMRELTRKGVVRPGKNGDGVFSSLFEAHLRQGPPVFNGAHQGVYVNPATGEVRVNGRPAPTLTNLEYRLLELLYTHLNQVCDKYAIVEAVWGENHIDSVYDASIEKLVSRVRKKIEPEPSKPQFLITVRGRGYKLVG